jgi:2-dehydropantoate 2-reductase
VEPVGVRTIAAVAEADAVELLHERGRAMVAAGSTDVRVSMLTDVETGRRLELGAVHQFLAAEAERLGVDAPLSRASAALLGALDSARRSTPARSG